MYFQRSTIQTRLKSYRSPFENCLNSATQEQNRGRSSDKLKSGWEIGGKIQIPFIGLKVRIGVKKDSMMRNNGITASCCNSQVCRVILINKEWMESHWNFDVVSRRYEDARSYPDTVRISAGGNGGLQLPRAPHHFAGAVGLRGTF